MDTLDVVIKMAEYCWRMTPDAICAKCPTDSKYGKCSLSADALHYLKEYQAKHDEILQMEEALGYCEIADNRQLWWDELKQMEGKPVFIKFAEYATEWFLIDCIDDNVMICRARNGDSEHLLKEHIGTFWEAYKREFCYGK